VAVSGGIDSMVLLDMLAKTYDPASLVVAHFDHGIRPDSQRDATFVQQAAARYGAVFETRREELGANASEALARNRRYTFLRELAEKYQAPIVTAHHLDDVVETAAINMTRGTGWRGVAAMSSAVQRPLLNQEKTELVAYAKKNHITWREDSTNATDAYLRNRLRRKTSTMGSDQKRELLALRAQQLYLKDEIEAEVHRLAGAGPEYERYFFTHVSPLVALECLRVVTKGRLTRPQLVRVLHAIKVARAGSVFEAGSGVKVHFSTRQFSL